MKFAKYFKSLSVSIIGSFITVLSCGCERELDFEYHDIEPIPVIEAAITAESTVVTIGYTTPMDEPLDNDRISSASVTLTDLTDGNVIALRPDSSGAYRSATGGVNGHEYRIDILTGDCHYSSVTRMLAPVEIEDLRFYWISMPGDDMAALRILFSDNPLTADYYWIRVYRNGVAYAMNAITDRAAADGIIEEVLTTTHRDEAQENDPQQLLRDGDIVTATVTPVDHAMFDYLVAISNGSNGAPQFGPDFCLGYFLASPVASATVVYHPNTIEYAQ